MKTTVKSKKQRKRYLNSLILYVRNKDGSIACGRCKGYMVPKYSYTDSVIWTTLECVNCGEILDKQIIQNRLVFIRTLNRN